MLQLSHAHALVVGIADYQHLSQLPRVKDAPDLAALLADPASCGYPVENVRLLLDAQATQAAIRQGLAALAQRSAPDSTVFIYFSGHGGQVRSGAHAGDYLLPVDTVYPSDEDLARTAISSGEFTAALNKIPARKVLVVLDCCHAGGIGQPKDLVLAATLRPGLSENYYQALTAGRGRAILASCRPEEFSYVSNGGEYGLFTEHLLGGLRGGAASADGLIRIFELFGYVQPRVTGARVVGGRPAQHPYLKFEGQENLPVALYRGGARGEVPHRAGGFLHDAYLSFADREPDRGYVWKELVPKLKREVNLRIAVSNDAEDAGVDRVVGIERCILQAKRTIILLSEAYLQDHLADFQANMAIAEGIDKGEYLLLPVKIAPFDIRRLPLRIRQLVIIDLTHPFRAAEEWQKFTNALRGPAPKRGR